MEPLTYADLEIRLFERKGNSYPVEMTLNGQQEFRGSLPVDDIPRAASVDPADMGRQLFEALVADGSLRSAWAEARGQAARRRIRLRIDPEAAELHALAWEALHDGSVLLAADADTPFSRYLPVSLPWGAAVEQRPLRVLVAISSPDDLETRYALAPVDVTRERQALAEAFAGMGTADFQVDYLDPPVTLDRLEGALRDGYHVLHFTGHGAFSVRTKQAALMLQDEDGHTRRVLDEDVAAMLARQGVQPLLVFLVACQSAARATTDAFLGLGPKLAAIGVPAVIAMQDLVTIASARRFSATFYERLLAHGRVDVASNEARSTLLSAGRWDAAVPVLFMRLTSGRLWTEAAARLEIPPLPEPEPLPDVTGFVGREAELAYLSERLASTHLAVITGMPGVGKTALAATLARRAHDPDKIFWHEFHQDEGINAILWKLAAFLARHGQADLWNMLQGAQQTGGQPPPAAVLFDYLFQMLRGHGYLLCFDDFQFVDDDPQLEQFIHRLRRALSAGELSVIIASRRAPEFVRVDEFEPLSGFNLEDTRILLAQHGIATDQAQVQQAQIFDTATIRGKGELLPAEIVANLHARSEGNALFLTLAVDRLKRTPHMTRFLSSLFAHEDIERFLLKEVDDDLNEDERAVMIAVAALLGYTGTRQAIEAVLEGKNVRRVLSDLSERHLLLVTESEAGRDYREHAIVQDFYYDALSQPERQAMHRRAGAYYEVTEERDAFKAALHFQHAEENEPAARLVTADVWALINQGLARPVRNLLESFTAEQLSAELWARVNLARGEIDRLRGEDQLARSSFEAALSALGALGTLPQIRELRAHAYRGMGELLQFQSHQEALDWLHRGLDELAEVGDSPEAALLHILVGSVQIALGDYTAALSAVQKGLILLPEGPSQLRASALMNLGTIYGSQGDIERGKAYTLQGLEISRQLHDHWQTLVTLSNLGIDKDIGGDWEGAVADYQEALALAEQLGSVAEQSRIENLLGVLYTLKGDDNLATKHLSRSLELARRHNLKEHLLYVLSSLADLQVRLGEWEVAESYLKEAEQLALEMDIGSLLPDIYNAWALVQLGKGEPKAALGYAEQSVKQARDLELSIEEGKGLRVLGQALLANGQREPALAGFEQSLSLLAERDPYQAARTKVEWGRYLVVSDMNADRGMTMLQEARATFRQLGAQRDLAAVEETLQYPNGGK